MSKRSFCILFTAVLAAHTMYAQLPPEAQLFNYDNNAFYSVSQTAPARFPFLIVVISNNIRLYSQEFHEYDDKLADSLWNDNNFRFKEARNNYEIVHKFDSSKALVFVQGVNKNNFKEYEYRILENNKTNNNWKGFDTFYPSTYQSGIGENDPEMAAIGYVGADWNNYLTIDVRKKSIDSIISSASILWLPHPPKVVATFAPNQFNNFFTLFKIRSQVESFRMPELQKEDSLLKTKHEFSSNENSIIFYLNDLIKKRLVEYKLSGPGYETDWKLNELDFNFIWLKDLKPGKYKLLIRYSIQRQYETIYEFEIKPAWQQTTWFKIIAGSLVAAFIGFIVVLFRNRTQQQKLLKEQLEKEKTEAELKGIRSQLNPHFVFNSLNSIQGLINRNDIPGANRYLSEFSKLMRETLNAGDKRFNSLNLETKLLQAYLALEQLRFGFKFDIQVQEGIDAGATELPSFLLQPLAENAVKHGVETLKEKGMVQIAFEKQHSNLLVFITDNGKGFNTAAREGYGLKLTRDRINLLNRTLKDQTIELNIESPAQGTKVCVTFKNWLA
ncbi:MAG: histidine kinase [Chitinophagaceae bacterium]